MKRMASLVGVPLALLLSVGWAGAAAGAGPTLAAAGAVGPAIGGVAARPAGIPPLRIPKLGIRGASIIPVGINGAGQLAVGSSVTAVYTWRSGPRPGRPGSTVIAGHTWSKGAGVFDNLGTMKKGDRFSVGRTRFSVTSVERVRTMPARQVRELFSDRGPSRAVLITCGDRSAVTGVYASRILVYATKVRG